MADLTRFFECKANMYLMVLVNMIFLKFEIYYFQSIKNEYGLKYAKQIIKFK